MPEARLASSDKIRVWSTRVKAQGHEVEQGCQNPTAFFFFFLGFIYVLCGVTWRFRVMHDTLRFVVVVVFCFLPRASWFPAHYFPARPAFSHWRYFTEGS